MFTRTFLLLSILAINSFNTHFVIAQTVEDREAVKKVVLDYVEGFYLVEPERIERSVSRKLAKVGYVKSDNGYREVPRTYEQLYQGSRRYNANGRVDPDSAPKKIEILDLMDQIAVVKLSAEWGVDYLNLAREDSQWKVINVLWQTYPEPEMKHAFRGTWQSDSIRFVRGDIDETYRFFLNNNDQWMDVVYHSMGSREDERTIRQKLTVSIDDEGGKLVLGGENPQLISGPDLVGRYEADVLYCDHINASEETLQCLWGSEAHGEAPVVILRPSN